MTHDNAEPSAASAGYGDEVMIEGTLRLTRRQWAAVIAHVRNDEALMEVGLAPQIGRRAMDEIHRMADAIASEIERATGVDGKDHG